MLEYLHFLQKKMCFLLTSKSKLRVKSNIPAKNKIFKLTQQLLQNTQGK